MEKRYTRNIPALTEQEQAILGTKHVLVAGCGGLGGNIIELLLRLGIGSITAVDCDVFDSSNLNRQLLSQVPLLGTPKAEAAAARAALVNPQVTFHAVQAKIGSHNAAELIQGCDAVLDALDNIESRKILAAACTEVGIPFIHGAAGGWNVQAAISMPGDGLMDILYPSNVSIKNKSVLGFSPALCASLQTALCTKLLCGRPVETGKLYLLDLQNMQWNAFFV